MFDEGVAFRKPLNEILIVNVVDRDVTMLVAFEKGRIVGKFPVYDGENMRDLAVG